jgi:holo-ACP synthase
MWCVVSSPEDNDRISGAPPPEDVRTRLLAAREERELLIRGLAAQSPGSLAFISTGVPGADKNRPGLKDLIERAIRMIFGLIPGAEVVEEGSGDLGPYAAITCPESPATTKRAAVEVEQTVRGGRLLDIDVHDVKGRAFGRDKLGLAPRRCLVCDGAAFDCIRAGKHTAEELEEAVRALVLRARSG